MRTLLGLGAVVVLLAGCSSSSSGGGVSLSFGDAGSSPVDNVSPAGVGAVTGTFSTSGDYEGQYTLTTQIPTGTPVSSCVISVDGAAPVTTAQVDDSTGQTHTLVVQVTLSSAYAGNAVCNVSAMNNAKSGVGDEVVIDVTGT